MIKYTLIIYTCLVLALISCKKESAVPETVATAVATKPTQENFTEFHSKLINDSVFRYSRINFPIAGYNSDAEKEPDNYSWTKEDWDFYFEEDAKYKQNKNIVSTTAVTDTLATWRLHIPNSGYDINYYFKPENNKWFLKSYSYKNY